MIRFAILSGVSSDIQVEDKASIGDQIQTCRRVIAQLGGVEVDCYTMDGYSRTGYDSLSDAMNDIPPLREAIESAEQDVYDVLILDNWDRLGDLGQLVNTRFKKYRKQIYSARQSGRVHDPEGYDPYSDESADIDMHVQGILQRYRLNKMRRGWNAGMPKRIEKGLTPLRVPFGYVWVSAKEPPRLDPARAALIQQMKDLLLKGRPMRFIAHYADESGIAPPNGGKTWDPTTIRYILANPYYAGTIGMNRSKYIYDERRKQKKRAIKQPRAKWLEGQGKHKPLWDAATHRALVKELDRRYQKNQYFAVRFALSGLLHCSECGKKLYRRSHGHGTRRWKVLSCEKGRSHLIIRYDEVVDLVAQELVKQLSEQVVSTDPAEDVPGQAAVLEELAKRRRRIQEGYEGGLYTQAEAAQKLSAISSQIEAMEQKAEARQNAADLRAEFASQFQDNINAIPDWIKNDDPQVVNRLLSALFEDIVISPDRQVEIVWRA
jgi:hypothetical protein